MTFEWLIIAVLVGFIIGIIIGVSLTRPVIHNN